MERNTLDDILQRLRDTEQELEQELDRLLDQQREQFRYRLQHGRVVFEQGMRQLQRESRTGLLRYLAGARLRHIVTAPLIYSLILPLALLDLFASLYQAVCFPVYRIPRIKRRDYIAVDRHQLAYLNLIEKANCVYCGYANGLLAYVREIAARTEQYWCPIKHARRTLDAHHYNERFVDYGDADGYAKGLESLRRQWPESVR